MEPKEAQKQDEFEIKHETEPSDTLLIGLTEFGMAGLTAANYIVEHLGLKETGYIRTTELPSITPFENGTPRHHTRFFSDEGTDLTVLVGELFIPVGLAQSFSDAVLDWTGENDVDNVTFVSGVPFPHAPEQHDTFYVATDDYREEYLAGGGIEPMQGGFLEGVNSNLVARGIGTPLKVGVLITPTHPPSQDIEAAVRLVEAFGETHDFDVDTQPLREYGEKVNQYYAQLEDRLKTLEEQRNRRTPEDRTYM